MYIIYHKPNKIEDSYKKLLNLFHPDMIIKERVDVIVIEGERETWNHGNKNKFIMVMHKQVINWKVKSTTSKKGCLSRE